MPKRKKSPSIKAPENIKTISIDRKIKNTTKDKFKILVENYSGTFKNLANKLNLSEKQLKTVIKNDFSAPAQFYKNISKNKLIDKIEKYTSIGINYNKIESTFINEKIKDSLLVFEFKQGRNSIYKSLSVSAKDLKYLDMEDIINSKLNEFRQGYNIKKLVGVSLKYGKK
jgi:hypothetical protein